MKVVDDMEWFNNLNKKKYKFDKKKIFLLFVLIFLIGSIAGFIYEEIFYFIDKKEIVKRGFLYGPYLPVYGFGAIAMLFLKKFKKNPLVVFLFSMLVAGIVEYITGYLLWEVYNSRWWDYTGLFLNINGYVCLRSVLTFGIGGLLLIYIIEPLISMFVNKVRNSHVNIWPILIILMFLIDLTFTLIFRNKI